MSDDKFPELIVKLKTKDQLYMASMPFVRDGGIFVATRNDYELGQVINLTLELIDENEPLQVEGKVIWKTPAGAQGNLQPGIGVQFVSKEANKVNKTIAEYLAGTDDSIQSTDTM